LKLNIEGISHNKADNLSRLLNDNKIQILFLQETHAEKEKDLLKRGNIAGFSLVCATYHNKYGTAIFIKNCISDWKQIYTTVTNNISFIHIRIGDINIVNSYKPPGEKWTNTTFPKYSILPSLLVILIATIIHGAMTLMMKMGFHFTI